MRYRQNNMRPFLMGPEMQRVCMQAAAYRMAKARGLIGKHTGESAASGHLVPGIGGKRQDRVKVTIVFDGHAVADHWGNARRPASRFLTRALEGE